MYRRKNTQVASSVQNDFNLMYPLEPQKYDDSINFLSLAYSGLANINEKQTKLFIKDDENRNYLKTIFNDIKYKKDMNEDDLGLIIFNLRFQGSN
jgi:hypothetical protein